MNLSLRKNVMRDISKSKARFISIMLIVALGVGFFTGVKATSPSMNRTAEDYYKENCLMDIKLLSTVGFCDKDVSEIQKLPHVRAVMPSYYSDVFLGDSGEGSVIRLYSNPTADDNGIIINKPVVKEGRLPEKKGEIALENANFNSGDYQLGDTVALEEKVGGEDVSDILENTEFTVVGFVQSPLYVSFERGNTDVGSGSIHMFGIVSPEEFKADRYSVMYVATDYSTGVENTITDSFDELIDDLEPEFEELGLERSRDFDGEYVTEVKAKLDDAKKKLEKEKKKAQKELKDGKSKLDSAEEEYNTKISEAKETLDTAQKEITKGEAEIKSGWASYNKGIEDGEKQISQSKAQLETARETLKTSKTEYNTKIREAEKQLNAAERQYNSGLKEYNEGLSQFKTQTAPAKIAIAALQTKYDTQLNKYENIVKPACEEAVSRAQKNIDEKTAQNEELQSELDNTYGEAQKALINGRIEINNGIIKANQSVIERENKRAGEQQSEVEEAKQALDDAKSEFEAQTAEPQAKLDEAKSRLDQAKEQIDSSKAELAEQKAQAEAGFQAAQTQITEGQAALTAAQTELSKQKTEGKQKLLESEEKLQTAKEELEEGKKEFEKQKTEGKNKLEKAKQDYLDGKAQAEKKLDDAQSKIDKAQAKLDDLENPEWYFMTRHDNPGYDSLIDDTTRVDAVAAVFPLFFLLVAALVCLTTLTRHVEEKRTEIGTLKALGYSNREIKGQFIFYAATAAFVGCAVGITAGVFTLPYVIYNAYGIMYELLELKLVVPIGIAVTGVVTAFVCTTLVAVYVCEKTLKEKPSQLMRPKAPKAAKRILLERIGFIWDRMNFTSKVTARNIARYKVRFFMTVVGVAGCTALILTGFGLKDSISSISDKQFGEIYTYDMIAVLDGEGSELEKSEALDFIARDKLVEDAMLQRQIPIKINNGKRSIEDSMYLYVPQSAESMTGFVHLRDRKSGDEIRLGDDGAVLTEKAAATLSVGIGDEITVVDDHRQYRVKISGISENYVNGYLFLSKDYYKQVFGKVPLFNMIMCRMTDSASENQSKLGEKCLDNKSIAAVSFISGGVDTFKDTIKSLDTVILVLIISAGLLAVVVLYNLTNINVAERVREIATIKVLGFYNNETCAFVYRENIILTLGGIAAGLGLGVILHRFVILTIEIDKTMFSRAIEPQSYLYAAVLTAIFAAFVNFIMYFKIKRIDMVESLKSVE